MSMTTELELAQRMKAAAQEATQGEWRWEGDGGFSYLLAEGDTSPENRIIDDGSAWGEYAETISPDSFDAAHIATSCPQNVLALVEALEARDKRNAELEQKADIYDMLREDYEINGSLVDFVDWQSKRIAELESRTVKLPEVRITIAESKLRNLTYQQLDAFNAGASRAVAKLSQVLAAAGVAVEGE
ncbi:ead/Ea22-like family protein [Escherichia coli]|nr:ead/Ea22-like family protein [Escherichia coli]